MFGSYLGGRWLDRGRGHQMWAACMAISIVIIVVISQIRDLVPLVAVFVVLGVVVRSRRCLREHAWWFGAGRNHPAQRSTRLHLFFALGALSAPLLTNRAIAWSDSLWPVAVPLAMLTVHQRLRAVVDTGTDEDSRCATAATTRRRPRRCAAATSPIVALFFFVYVALEVGFANWIHSYVEQIGYGDANTATGVTATFWIGFSVGRVVSIWLASRFSAVGCWSGR